MRLVFVGCGVISGRPREIAKRRLAGVEGDTMGQPVIHFEVIGKDGDALRSFYSTLFDWEIDANNPMNYGVVQRDGNTTPDGMGIGGGVAQGPDGYGGHVTFYVDTPDIEAALPRRRASAGPACSVRSRSWTAPWSSASSPTPRALDRRSSSPCSRAERERSRDGSPHASISGPEKEVVLRITCLSGRWRCGAARRPSVPAVV